LLTRLDRKGLLGPSRIEVRGHRDWTKGYLQPADALGYEVFFADRATMLEKGEYRDLARSLVRLWGYSDNLKELREPAKLERFIRRAGTASSRLAAAPPSLPVIAPASARLQDAAQIGLQEAGSKNPS
jgi:hypothetical protein